jgi:hypothetical protein
VTLTSPCASLLNFSNPTRDTSLEPKNSRPKVKRIGFLGDNGDHPSSPLVDCALGIRAFIIEYNLGGNKVQYWICEAYVLDLYG